MTRISTDTANDVGGEILLLGAIVFAMSNLTTVLACLVFIITKCTVQGCELSKLISLQFVLTLGNRSGLRDISILNSRAGRGERIS